jgi:hypothetical protein
MCIYQNFKFEKRLSSCKKKFIMFEYIFNEVNACGPNQNLLMKYNFGHY